MTKIHSKHVVMASVKRMLELGINVERVGPEVLLSVFQGLLDGHRLFVRTDGKGGTRQLDWMLPDK